jgi:hypothetical protein
VTTRGKDPVALHDPALGRRDALVPVEVSGTRPVAALRAIARNGAGSQGQRNRGALHGKDGQQFAISEVECAVLPRTAAHRHSLASPW